MKIRTKTCSRINNEIILTYNDFKTHMHPHTHVKKGQNFSFKTFKFNKKYCFFAIDTIGKSMHHYKRNQMPSEKQKQWGTNFGLKGSTARQDNPKETAEGDHQISWEEAASHH